MINYGCRSRGCLMCIRRRIKCDETKPACNRCKKHKVECPGYRDPGSRKFVSENYNVVVQSARQRGLPEGRDVDSPNSSFMFVDRPHRDFASKVLPGTCDDLGSSWSRSPESELSNNAVKSKSLSQIRSSPLSGLWAGPTVNWHDRSLCLFFRDFTLREDKYGTHGYLGFLPEMYQESINDPVLRLAVQATASAATANRTNLSLLESKARLSYGQALTSVNYMLRTPEEAIKDRTIVSVMLLILFEVCNPCLDVGHSATDFEPQNIAFDYYHFLQNHDEGLRSLLELRGDAQLNTCRGREILLLARSQMVSQSMLLKQPDTHRGAVYARVSREGLAITTTRVAEITNTYATRRPKQQLCSRNAPNQRGMCRALPTRETRHGRSGGAVENARPHAVCSRIRRGLLRLVRSPASHVEISRPRVSAPVSNWIPHLRHANQSHTRVPACPGRRDPEPLPPVPRHSARDDP